MTKAKDVKSKHGLNHTPTSNFSQKETGRVGRKAHAEECVVTVRITLRIHLLKHKA